MWLWVVEENEKGIRKGVLELEKRVRFYRANEGQYQVVRGQGM